MTSPFWTSTPAPPAFSPSRSAAVQRAIQLLRHPDLDQDYTAAWDEWTASGDQAAWETTAGDGLADAPR